MPKFRPN